MAGELTRILAALFASVAFSSAMSGAEHWIRVSTPDFEMYTTNGEKQATSALKVFEQVRYFFLQNSRTKSAPQTPVRIIAFHSEKEYKPYRMNEGAFAYYLRSRKVDYIVMQDISTEHYQAAVHEYTHLIVEHLDLKLPVWLNEGLADLYSSLEPKGDQAVVGRPLAGRAGILVTQRWMDLNALFAVDGQSPYYNEREKMSIFYAESWALTHMLALGQDYKPGFSKFMAAIGTGHSAADALQSVYGKSVAQVTLALHAYLRQASVQAAVFDVKLSKPDLEPVVSDAPELNVELALADLLASQKRTLGEAAERLEQLAAAHPESPDVQESLGYLAWEQKDTKKAQECFKLAFDRGSKDPEMLLHYSQLMRYAGTPDVQILPVLEKAAAIKPDDRDVWFNLGVTALNAKRWGEALNAFSQIKTVTPDRAYGLFSGLAYCNLQLKETKQARALAEKAKQYAKTPDEQAQAASMLQHLDFLEQHPGAQSVSTKPATETVAEPTAQTETPALGGFQGATRELPRDVPSVHWPANLAHVEGVAKSFECGAKGQRLHVTVDGKEMVFIMADPKQVIVRNAANGVLDMQCGPQKPFRVGVFFVPTTESGQVDGTVRELVL